MKKNLLVLLTILLSSTIWAQQLPEPLSPPRMVNDFAKFLTPNQTDALEQRLVQFYKETSTQIAIVTVSTLDGMDKSDYAARLFDKWGIGAKDKNNGILILIKPKNMQGKGEVFISVGYGLEGAVPDALAGRIVDYDLLPAFKAQNNFEGLNSAITTLIGLTRGEFTAEEYLAKEQNKENEAKIIISALLMFAILFLVVSKVKSGGYTISSSPSAGGVPPIFFGGLGSSSRSSSGFGGFSGGGGGGFSGGFGGGFTGGGGAGGSW